MAKVNIPKSIRKIIGSREYSIDTIGMSGSQVICFDDMVLKSEEQCEESDNEHKMISWLEDKLPVPKILCKHKENGINYLLMSKIIGAMSCSTEILENPEMLVKLLAEGLKMLWSVDIADCPYSSSVENKPDEEFVFSHGDYCLPNIFIKGNSISGFIDLGRSGVADKYQDIALCYRSLQHNYNGKYGGKVYKNFNAELLFDELGILSDWDKIKYYTLLDELF